jgi:hypothetical protein
VWFLTVVTLLVWNATGTVTCFTHNQPAAKTFVAFLVDFASSVANVTFNHACARLNLPFTLAFDAVYWYQSAAFAFRTVYFTITITSLADQQSSLNVR